MTPLVVSRRSWHYRLYHRWREELGAPGEPKDLCRYFWSVVISAPTLVCIWAGRLVAAIVAPVARVTHLTRPAKWVGRHFAILWLSGVGIALGYVIIVALLHDWAKTLIAIVVTIGAIVTIIIAVAALAVFLDWRSAKRRPGSTSTVRLAAAFISAKKRRICPLIKIGD